jgi:hypothetical protein
MFSVLLTYLLTPWSRVYGCVILPLETLHPGDPNGGVDYLRIILSPEEASLMDNS